MEWGSEQVKQWVSAHVSEWENTEQVKEWECDWVKELSECVNGTVSKLATEWVSEWVSMQGGRSKGVHKWE